MSTRVWYPTELDVHWNLVSTRTWCPPAFCVHQCFVTTIVLCPPVFGVHRNLVESQVSTSSTVSPVLLLTRLSLQTKTRSKSVEKLLRHLIRTELPISGVLPHPVEHAGHPAVHARPLGPSTLEPPAHHPDQHRPLLLLQRERSTRIPVAGIRSGSSGAKHVGGDILPAVVTNARFMAEHVHLDGLQGGRLTTGL